MLFRYSKAKGERFGWVDSDNGEYVSFTRELVYNVGDLEESSMWVCLATSPDWEAVPDTDGLGFWHVGEVNVAGERPDLTLYSHIEMCRLRDSWSEIILTGTPESFEVDEESWVHDGTADDEGLRGWFTGNPDDYQPSGSGWGWPLMSEYIAQHYDDSDVILTWLPEDFAPEPDVPEPTPETELSHLAELMWRYNKLSEAGKAYIRSRLGGVA